MEEHYIDFRRERDFGQVFNDTFAFLKQEYKRLGKVLLFYVIPLLVITSIFSTVIQYRNLAGIFSQNPGNMLGSNMAMILINLLISVVAQTIMAGGIYGYISLYVEKGRDGFSLGDVWDKITRFFWPIIFTSIVVGLIVVAGAIFFIIPGIYLAVSLSLILFIVVHEQDGLGYSFSRSFELTRIQWWWTFLLIIVVYVLVIILIYILAIPTTIIMSVYGLHAITQSASIPEGITITLIVLNVLTNILGTVLYVIPYTALSFQYFNLVEIKESPSLMDKIDEINEDE